MSRIYTVAFRWKPELYLSVRQRDFGAVQGVTILEMARNAQRLFDSEEPMQKRRLLNFVVSNSTWANGELNASLREPFGFIAEMVKFTSGGGSSNGASFADHSAWLGN